MTRCTASRPGVRVLRRLLNADSGYGGPLRAELFQWFNLIGVDPRELGEWVEELCPPYDSPRSDGTGVREKGKPRARGLSASSVGP